MTGFLRAPPFVHLDIGCDEKLSDIVADGFDAGILLAGAVPQDTIAIRLTDLAQFAAVTAASRGFVCELLTHDASEMEKSSSAEQPRGFGRLSQETGNRAQLRELLRIDMGFSASDMS